MFLPISTDTSVRRTPWVNYGLIGTCIAIHAIWVVAAGARPPGALTHAVAAFREMGTLQGIRPQLHEFITYQFLHANFAHIAGNMLFLWIFGNPVNAKMGHLPYLLFYLAGGIFAATIYGFSHDHALIGASGSIAAVTTAYLVLYPRSHITVLYWWFIIGTFEVPSMWMIVFKLIFWDNILAPQWIGESNIAFDAHLAGYGFGFVATILMLALRALPRDQFDLVALWHRWLQRTRFKSATSSPEAQARMRFGRVARPVSDGPHAETATEPADPTLRIRAEISEALRSRDWDRAATLYEKLNEIDPRQVLPRQQQLDVANRLYTLHRLPQAAAAYDAFLRHYPTAPESVHVRLLLGIIYARDLQQYEVAEGHLTLCLTALTDIKRRQQCLHWLATCARELGNPPPEGYHEPGTH